MDARERQAALEQARQGNTQALGQLLQSFRPYLRVILRSFRDERLQGRVDDSDLMQDALLEAHRSFADFRGETVGQLVMWLRRIVLRTAGHTVRSFAGTGKRDLEREQPADDLEGLAADTGSSPSAQAIRHEQAALMAEALAELPEDMQQVLLARHVEDLPYAVIAQRMERSENAVRMLYVRALKRLRVFYKG
jgi:RNA polymerase sigma-70 factor (ECF subfamily)